MIVAYAQANTTVVEYPSPDALFYLILYLVLAGVGTLVVGFIVSQVVHMFNQRSANETFRTVMEEMAKTTIVAVESIKETTVTGINAIMDMSTVNDVYNIARNKVNQNGQSSQSQPQSQQK